MNTIYSDIKNTNQESTAGQIIHDRETTTKKIYPSETVSSETAFSVQRKKGEGKSIPFPTPVSK